MISGRCECGKVRYEVDAEISDFSHCHCSQCRRLHGAAFTSFGGIARDRFRYLSGEADLACYASSDTTDRIFCAVCGSNILVDYKPEPDVLYITLGTVDGITLGTVDGDPICPPAYHQFVGSKAPWHEICDDLRQYDTRPDD